MHKKCITALIFSLCFIFLSACSHKGKNTESIQLNTQGDFVTYLGPQMVSTPKGYYVNQSGFLYFISPDFSESTIVCDKLECIHNEKEIENYMDCYECNAYFGFSEYVFLGYHENYLYIAGEDFNSTKSVIYRVSMDGTERTVFYECQGALCGFCVYEDNLYIGEKIYKTDDAEQLVTMVPIEKPQDAKTIYKTTDYPSRSMNRMKCCYGYCYFFLYDPALTGEDYVYIKINLETGESEEMYKASLCWMELGEEETLLHERKYQSLDPITWSDEYYSINPEDGEMTRLTEKDFASIGNRDFLRNMDDKYVYFISMGYGADAVSQEEQMLYVYDYDGNLAAEIPASDFGELYYVLPGTDDYMFIQTQPTNGIPEEAYPFFYIDKSEFNGGIVEAHRINITK